MIALLRKPVVTALRTLRELVAPGIDIDEASSSARPSLSDDAARYRDLSPSHDLDTDLITLPHNMRRRIKVLSREAAAQLSAAPSVSSSSSSVYVDISHRQADVGASSRLSTPARLLASDSTRIMSEDVESGCADFSSSVTADASSLRLTRRATVKPACCQGCVSLPAKSPLQHTLPKAALKLGKKQRSPTKRKSISDEAQKMKRARPLLDKGSIEPPTCADTPRTKGGKATVKRRNSACATTPKEKFPAVRWHKKTQSSSAALLHRPNQPQGADSYKLGKPDMWIHGAADDSASDSDSEDWIARYGQPASLMRARLPTPMPLPSEATPDWPQGNRGMEREDPVAALAAAAALANANADAHTASWVDTAGSSSTHSTPGYTDYSSSSSLLTPAMDLNSPFELQLEPYTTDPLLPDNIRDLAIAALANTPHPINQTFAPPPPLTSFPNDETLMAQLDPDLLSKINELATQTAHYSPHHPNWPVYHPMPPELPRLAPSYDYCHVAEALAAFVNIDEAFPTHSSDVAFQSQTQ